MIGNIFLIAFIVMAIHATMWEGGIFGFVRDLMKDAPEWIQKPVYDCPICQTPYYGTLAFFLIFKWDWKEWAITIIGAMGVNVVFYLISNKD